MKKFLSLVMLGIMSLVLVAPSMAAVATGEEAVNNIHKGKEQAAWSWTEVMENTHVEASKFDNAPEQLLGVAAGTIIGVRKGLHRIGAGAIDILTFWIPKDKELRTPSEPAVQ